MNNTKKISLFFITCVMVWACETTEVPSTGGSTVQTEEAQSIAESGNWRITRFIDSGDNETSDFTGYTFTFADNGELIATNGSNTLTGTWSITNSSSSSSSSPDFNIFFPVPNSSNFEDLNDDWYIEQITQSKIELIDISGGNGGTDRLTFTKN